MKNKILIIGSLPPPIGGLSIYTKRLIYSLSEQKFPHEFLNLKTCNIIEFFASTFKYKIIHLHTSNIYVKFGLLLLSILCNKKLIITFHRDLSRYKSFDKLVLHIILKKCSIPILLNSGSYLFAKKLNTKSQLISSFIPPQIDSQIDSKIISEFPKGKFKRIFSTYAFGLALDQKGVEIYQIMSIYEIFLKMPQYLLIISDPSGQYEQILKSKYSNYPENIKIIPHPHNFIELLLISDCFIRFTSTDGDSIAVREALYFKINVIASNNVPRPEGVELVEFEKSKLEEKIKNFTFKPSKNSYSDNFDTIQQIINLYKDIGILNE